MQGVAIMTKKFQTSPYRGCKGFHPSNQHILGPAQNAVSWIEKAEKVPLIKMFFYLPTIEGLWQPTIYVNQPQINEHVLFFLEHLEPNDSYNTNWYQQVEGKP